MNAKPLVKLSSQPRKLVAKRVAGGCGCGTKRKERGFNITNQK
ncbi:hypothetical protein J43TS3_26930 [Ornithinibacillus bavariensis]|uniref:Uncharacterized protein n=1 Tax=Ornithinibacillus bavariensis TaxID=545502 RepID=A0A919X8Q8_9BACI|nr:hypothetical protein J43TS3_26930 [Ornithinibacillus bavariensis]